MTKLLLTTISGIFFLFSSSIVSAADHADDERMDEHHSTTGAPAVNTERLPAQIRLNAKACEGKSSTDRVMDQTSGSMVTCSKARKELKTLEKKIDTAEK